MAAKPIPVIQVSGTHREVGQQIGEKVKSQLQRILPRLRENLPPGVSWENMLLKGRLCLAHSRAVYPQFVEELEGIAEAAELPFEEVFLAICEELTVTVFSIIINLNELRAWIGGGRPCQTAYTEHKLDPWTPPEDWPWRYTTSS